MTCLSRLGTRSNGLSEEKTSGAAPGLADGDRVDRPWSATNDVFHAAFPPWSPSSRTDQPPADIGGVTGESPQPRRGRPIGSTAVYPNDLLRGLFCLGENPAAVRRRTGRRSFMLSVWRVGGRSAGCRS
jgi:hypothetical protein